MYANSVLWNISLTLTAPRISMSFFFFSIWLHYWCFFFELYITGVACSYRCTLASILSQQTFGHLRWADAWWHVKLKTMPPLSKPWLFLGLSWIMTQKQMYRKTTFKVEIQKPILNLFFFPKNIVYFSNITIHSACVSINLLYHKSLESKLILENTHTKITKFMKKKSLFSSGTCARKLWYSCRTFKSQLLFFATKYAHGTC